MIKERDKIKQEDSEQEARIKFVNFLVKKLKQANISAIMQIPEFGTIAFFENDADKVLVLDHANTEMLCQQKLREEQARQWALNSMTNSKKEKKKELKYIG